MGVVLTAIDSRRKRRILRLAQPHLLFLLLVGSFAAPAPAQSPESRLAPLGLVADCPGDINLDGERGPGDLALLAAHISGQSPLEGQALANADANSDYAVDVGDSQRLLQHLTGELTLFPCGDFSPLEVPCPGLSLQQVSAMPLERVPLGAVPETFADPLFALVMDGRNELGRFTFVERLEDGSITLFTPFYPGVETNESAVRIQVTDGILACPWLDFSIPQPPPAPGAYSDVVDVLQTSLDATTAAFGATPQGRPSGGEEVEPYEAALAVVQTLLDDPDNPDSLRAIGEGTAPFLEGDSDNSLLDATIAFLGIEPILVDGVIAFGEVAGVDGQGRVPSCNDSPEALDFCMKLAAKAEKLRNPPEDGAALTKLKEDAALSMAVLRRFPVIGADVRAIEKVTKLLSKQIKLPQKLALALAAQKWIQEAAACLLPSTLTDLEFNLFPARLNEDEPDGEWGLSSLTATSKGWKLDARRIVEYAFEKLNVKDKLGKGEVIAVRKILEATGVLPDGTSSKDLENRLVDLVEDAVKRTHEVPDALKKGPLLEIPPREFGPVDVDAEEWTESEIRGTAVAKLDHNKFEPLRVGSSDVIVRTRMGKFSGQGLTQFRKVQVDAIVIRITPAEVALKPGEQATFTVTVENSFFPDQIEEEAAGETVLNLGSGNTHTIDYTAPSDDKLPDTLTIRHTATTGARGQPGALPVANTARIRGKPVVILFPLKSCVDPGQSTDIDVTVQGTKNKEVTWNLKRLSGSGGVGTISQQGRFVAPNSPGHIEVTATSVENTDAMDVEVIKVGGCDCWWMLSVGTGTVVGIADQDKASFVIQNGVVVAAGFEQLVGGVFGFLPATPPRNSSHPRRV